MRRSLGKLLILLFFSFFWIIFTKQSKATTFIFIRGTCVDTGTCNYGASCGDCGSQTSECCSLGAQPYTKYTVTCSVGVSWDSIRGYNIDIITVNLNYVSNDICSIGDKCISGEIGLRSGSCTCGVYSSSIYKYCCDATTGESVGCIGSNWDGQYPPEGSCPGGSYTPSQGVVGGYYTSWSPCVPKNTCTGTCYVKYTSSQTACSGFNAGSSVYTEASGSCGVSDQLCCNMGSVACTSPNDSRCNDGDPCTDDTCSNPNTTSAVCVNTDNHSCDGNTMYYCNTSTWSCVATSSNYTSTTECNTALADCSANHPTWACATNSGSCYSLKANCQNACQDPTIEKCVKWNCSPIDGSCGWADGNVFSSKPSSGLCDDGNPSYVSTSGGYYTWTCYGDLSN